MELFVFDLDGTLLNADSAISPYTRETLQLLNEQGVLYTVATGRALHGAQDILAGQDIANASHATQREDHRLRTVRDDLSADKTRAATVGHDRYASPAGAAHNLSHLLYRARRDQQATCAEMDAPRFFEVLRTEIRKRFFRQHLC